MDPNSFSVIVGVISAAVSGLLTLLVTKGIDGWLKLRADARTDIVREETKEDVDLRYIIERQDKEIASLRTELREIHLQHNDCERKHESLRVRLEFMEGRMTKVEKDVEEHK